MSKKDFPYKQSLVSKKMIVLTCYRCGKEFDVYKIYNKKRHPLFCSANCRWND